MHKFFFFFVVSRRGRVVKVLDYSDMDIYRFESCQRFYFFFFFFGTGDLFWILSLFYYLQ